MQRLVKVQYLVSIAVAFLAYQNCAKINFLSDEKAPEKSMEISACSFESSVQCLIAHGTGSACLNSDNSMGSCRPLLCDPGYNLDGSGICVPSSCSPASVGENACSNISEVGYGKCGTNGVGIVKDSCLPLFCRGTRQEASSASCPADSCIEDSPCNERNGTGTQSCSSGSKTCNLNQCEEGFDFKAGICVARACVDGELKNCMTEWGSGNRKCSEKHFDVICEPLACPAHFEIKIADHGYKICSPMLCPNGRDLSGACTIPVTNTTMTTTTTTTMAPTTTTTTTTLPKPTTTTTTLPSRPFSCLQYQVISFPAMIPARDSATGICYYQKILSAVPLAKSSGTHLDSVLARSHDDSTYGQTLSPYILGRASAKFTLLGTRNLKLSGAIQQLSSIRVDNFLLVGIVNETQTQTMIQAYGTADSKITGTNFIKANNQEIALTPFQSAGTATIDALLINKIFNINEKYIINIDALDCGGSKELSEVYLVFE